MSDAVKPITSFPQFMDLLDSNKPNKPFVIDFWATWCGPCRAIRPVFEKLAEGEAKSKLGFYSVDIDAQAQIAEEIGITSMPTFIVFKGGKKVDEMSGAYPSNLQALVAKAAA
ncbi:putative thioredoxin [Calocera cornea HHB12733]|uniref:Thioredoxin n=1 Tax=Calocera cornea HHB12733 TaxID=1353952 RepID=A0A165K5E2_9BASI|nr:putative thioredoxin [Calocera cornea HHB12733]